MSTKQVFLAYVPFTGLGLYGGFRGNRWLRNRIKIFKQFVIPSLLNQTDQDFILWVQWRPEERNNKYVQELSRHLSEIFGSRWVFTFGGLCFWDDKYEDKIEHGRLAEHLHYTMPDLFEVVGQATEVIMLIQPSDDLYEKHAVRRMKDAFASEKTLQAVGYQQGYHMDYLTKDLREYNPTTNPPFFAIRFPAETFLSPQAHMAYTGPYKSHEYVPTHMRYWKLPGQGFMVGSHTENISTHFNHPFTGPERIESDQTLSDFGILEAPTLELPVSLRKKLIQKLPFGWQKRLRYLFGEKGYNKIYQFIRN